MSAELDGAPPSEAVLAVDDAGDVSGERPVAGAVYVLRRDGLHWVLVGAVRLESSQAWDGTYDGRPGLQVVRAERILGACRDALRVEWLDMQGGMDPRHFRRTLELYAMDGGKLARIFECDVENEVVRGPARAGREENYATTFERAQLPARIHVEMTSTWDPGVGDDATPADGRGASEAGASDYHFDGHRYVSPDGVCERH